MSVQTKKGPSSGNCETLKPYDPVQSDYKASIINTNSIIKQYRLSVKEIYERVPAVLKNERVFCLWRYELRGDKKTKVPLIPETVEQYPKGAKSNDDDTWRTLDQCLEALVHPNADHYGYEGLGVFFKEELGVIGIDLDDAVDDEYATLDWANSILKSFSGLAYAEESPSATGYKIWLKAKLPESFHKHRGTDPENPSDFSKGHIEVYKERRFFTLTLSCLGDGFKDIQGDAQEPLDALLKKYRFLDKVPAVERSDRPQEERPTVSFTGVNSGEGFSLEQRVISYLSNIAPESEGNRDNAAYKISGHCLSFAERPNIHLDEETLADLICRYWDDFNSPPLGRDYIREKLRSAKINGNPPDDKFPEHDEGLQGIDISHILPSEEAEGIAEKAANAEPEPGFPFDLIPTEGLIGDYYRFQLETAIRPQPELAFAGAIALMSGITGQKVQGELKNTRTNMYLLCLAESGDGKGHAFEQNAKLLAQCGMSSWIGAGGFASGAGLTTSLRDHGAVLFQADEMGEFFSDLNSSRKPGWLAEVIKNLKEVYSASSWETWKGKAHKDKGWNVEVSYPHVALLGACCPNGFWENLSVPQLEQGFIGRTLIFEEDPNTTSNPVDLGVGEEPFPPEILEAVKFWKEYRSDRTDSIADSLKGCNTICADAFTIPRAGAGTNEHFKKRLEDYINNDTAKKRIRGDSYTAPWTRAAEQAHRLAVIFAANRMPLLADPQDVRLELDDIERAIGIVDFLTARTCRKAKEYVAYGQAEANKKKLLRIFKAGQILTKTQIARKSQWIKAAKDRAEMLNELILAGELVPVEPDPNDPAKCPAERFMRSPAA